jgi:hypothetical protein
MLLGNGASAELGQDVELGYPVQRPGWHTQRAQYSEKVLMGCLLGLSRRSCRLQENQETVIGRRDLAPGVALFHGNLFHGRQQTRVGLVGIQGRAGGEGVHTWSPSAEEDDEADEPQEDQKNQGQDLGEPLE